MDKPEGELLLKPIVKPEDIEEEPVESDRISSNENTPSTLEEEVNGKPPLAIPEVYEDDLNKPEVTLEIPDNRAFLDREIHDDEDVVDLADRAGGGGFPYAPGFGPGLNGGTLTAGPESIPDVNLYQQKKTVAQGMMDLALFSANANQLRYVLESRQHAYYYPGIVLISFSLIFQVSSYLILHTQCILLTSFATKKPSCCVIVK